ncbi:MAG: peptide chain release factor 1 [Desulfomonile tiedjei]|uniref:Peptide chain release factor 1 n=1 Tax=Desulfomonile tiedjei TaxID=2358 RepID=A0A9D6V4H6_9BACT|nr:peptide chain release factor 1 [Desulfomonile tiedjei]
MQVLEKLEEIKRRYEELDDELSKPEIISDLNKLKKVAKEQSDLADIVKAYGVYTQVCREIEELEQIIQDDEDPELVEIARQDLSDLKERESRIHEDINLLLLPRDPNDEKNTFLEIRAGTGGEEAALFAADLFRSYCRYAEARNWRVELMSSSPAAAGGIKEVIALIQGNGAYSRLKYERGVHRVQRVPTTESQGRIHTSAVTVAVLPEADDVEVQIDPKDLKIDVYRSSGPGGQSVNTTDSAVRVTHVPTNLVVTCQDEKSQHKNKAKALKILKARLLDRMQEEQNAEISKERKNQVGSGDRSERIRTYNFPQNRVTDHRIGLTLYKLEEVLEGKLDDIIDPLSFHYQTEALKDSFLQ